LYIEAAAPVTKIPLPRPMIVPSLTFWAATLLMVPPAAR
jgi:hypothetical protein